MNVEMLDTLDTTIVSICDLVQTATMEPKERADTVMALAMLVEARANAEPKYDVLEIQKNFENYLEKWSKSKRASFSE